MNAMNAFETTRERAAGASRWITEKVKTQTAKAWTHFEALRTKGAAAAKEAVDAAEDAAEDAVASTRKAVSKVKAEASSAVDKVEAEAKKTAQAAKKTAAAATKKARVGVAKATTGPVSAKMSRADLYEIATSLDISGRSNMKKAELLSAIKAVQAD